MEQRKAFNLAVESSRARYNKAVFLGEEFHHKAYESNVLRISKKCEDQRDRAIERGNRPFYSHILDRGDISCEEYNDMVCDIKTKELTEYHRKAMEESIEQVKAKQQANHEIRVAAARKRCHVYD